MNEKYIFEAEWYDKVASVLKKFYLYYYPFDNTVELVYLFNILFYKYSYYIIHLK